MPTAEFFGIEEGLERERNPDTNSTTESRAACVYIKRVVDMRRRARSCFAKLMPPLPPPPPPLNGISSAQTEIDHSETERVAGFRDVHPAAIPVDQDAYVLEANAALADTRALIATLGNNNPILRGFLGTAVSDLETEVARTRESAAARPTVTASGNYEPSTAGRRLLERDMEFPAHMEDALVQHPIQTRFRAGIPGVSRAACEALCEALAVTANNTDPERCNAFGFFRQNPFSLTDTVGRCYLLTSAGGCETSDFGAMLWSRQVQSERQCHAAAPGYDNPLCLQLATTRDDTRVLSYSNALSIAAQTPEDAAPGSGGLPVPRSALEAGSFIAFARREGVYAFWGGRVDNLYQDVTTHWVAPGGVELVVKKGDPRCILVSSTTSSTAQAMHARMESCSAKLADGIVTVAASAAPPPPPGGDGSFDPYHPGNAPPPPPSTRAIGYTIYKREVIKFETRAICSGAAGEGLVHREICQRVLDSLGKFQFLVGVGLTAPLCSPICWRVCDSQNDGEADDSFNECPQLECAQTSCYSFLLNECPPVMHTTITSTYQKICSIAPPSPPAPPRPPPSPPAPPRSPPPSAPPPLLNIVERLRDEELDSDPDCGLISITECQEAIRQFSQRNGGEERGYSRFMRVSRAHCEGLEVETDCFVGCAVSRTGGVYRFLPPEVQSSKFTRNRCRLSDHERCFCSPDSIRSPPPAFYSPPPPVAYDQEWNLFFPDYRTDNTIDTRYGTLGVFHKRILNGRTLDLSLRDGPMHAFDCPARDDGADTCGTICAKHHLSRLRAYTVTGEHYNSPPPPPPPPTQPPSSPPPFAQTNASEPFNGCQTSCAFSDKETLCRDGGKGSFSPALCSYATMCTLCGPRPRVESTEQEIEGDDSCAYANDGVCQDGGENSEFIRIDAETSTHLCGFATDTTDCGARTVSTVDSSSFNFNPTPPLPRPPPPPPYAQPTNKHSFVFTNT